MNHCLLRRHPWALLPLLAFVGIATVGGRLVDGEERVAIVQDGEKPELSLRASPKVAFVPAEILFIAELRGGADDFEEFYCASIEWVWDDATRSTMTPDCEPYEAGASKIRRRFSTRHRFDRAGRYEVRLHLKQRGDVVASARTNIQVRGGFPFD